MLLLHSKTHLFATVFLVTSTLANPGHTQNQKPYLFDRAYVPQKVQQASVKPVTRLDVQNTSGLIAGVENLLAQRLSAADLDRMMQIIHAPDTGAKASTYSDLAAQLPTSAATITRLFRRISATENVSNARLQQDLMGSIFHLTGDPGRKSSQATPSATSLPGATEVAGLTGANAAAAAAAAGLALAVMASGSTGRTCGTTCDDFATEYDAQYGLGLINAKSKNDAGNTGAGVRVSVVDSGIFAGHSEFTGRSVGGVNYSGSGTFDSDENGHGTHVASTIGANRDMLGMRGVAYDVDLYSYKIFDGTGASTGLTDVLLAGIYNQHATDSIKVSNNSWGSSVPITAVTPAYLNAALPLTLAAAANAQTSGTIFVWATGNDSGSEVSLQAGVPYHITSLAPQWLSVTAVDSTKTEAWFANRCGVAWETCVTAPGVDIYAAWNSGTSDYNTISGTSMAAPHVSGLVALLIEEFPSLTPAQIVTRLKSTATYDGLTGRSGCTLATCTLAQMRAIFGHGLVNQQAATAVIGSLNYTTSANIYSGPSVSIASVALTLPGGLSGASVSAINEASFTAFDSFDGAAFSVSGSEVFSTAPIDGGSSVGYATFDPNNGSSDRFRSLAVLSDGSGDMPAIYMSQSFAPIDVASLTVWGDKATLLPTPSFIKAEQVKRIEMIVGNNGSGLKIIPYMQLTNSNGEVKTGGFGANFVYDIGSDTRIVASLGRGDTAFDFDLYGGSGGQRTSLNTVEFGFSQKINTSWELFGRVAQGHTPGFQATTTNWGLEDASFNRAGFGAEYKSKSGAQIAFGVVNAGNFTSGQVSLVTATGRQTNGDVNFTNQSFNAASSTVFAPFLAVKMPFGLTSNLKGMMTFSAQQARFGGAISKADLSLSIRF